MEKKWVLDNAGTEIVALTYEGSIPAPLIVVHQNDYVELTLKNPSTNVMEHNIDLHAATGALGGAALTTIVPGEEAVLRFKADRVGAFLHHCAPEGSMTPYHVTHGMTAVPQSKMTEPAGSFGSNEYGIDDLRENVWKWTDTCQIAIDTSLKQLYGCISGRYAMGQTVAVLTDLLRTPGNAGCGGGQPPTNVGVRLVWQN